MADSISIKLNGRRAQAVLPAMLRSANRGAGEAADPFLPPGYLAARASFDVGATARGAADGAGEQEHDCGADEVLVIELADGSTFITSADRLKASLALSQPGLIGANGEILFEQMRAEGAASRGIVGEAIGGLVSKVFALAVGEAPDAIIEAARAKLGSAVGIGVSWAGTKALMWAIESVLDRPPGLYRWAGSQRDARDLEDVTAAELAQAAAQKRPLLVFVHGTGSNTLGSFGDLQAGEREVWTALERHYPGGVFAFEHRTLSEGPIDNALALARALPAGSHLSLVSHSRGGLVADLLCVTNFELLIDRFEADLPGTGDADPAEVQRVLTELGTAHAEQGAQLRALAAELTAKQFVLQRYVRVASPAQGTKLASANFDLFLSGLLTLIGQVPFFFGNPLYSAFKRVVLEIARNRTNPHLVPGIEAMLPDAPMASFLRAAPVVAGIEMAVIAGDIEGGNLLKRLGLLLTDFLLFDNVDNDLVVDTAAMLGGIAPRAGSRALFDRGAEVSHFRYFSNADTRAALRDWLVAPEVAPLKAFSPLPGNFSDVDALVEAAQLRSIGNQRGGALADLPVVVVLPGVMGSHLWVRKGPQDASGVAAPRGSPVGLGRPGADRGTDRVWFDPADIAFGGLEKIGWGRDGVEAEKLFSMFYGKLCEHLAVSHRVEPFAYDWRQPLDVLAERLGEFLDRLLKQTHQPIRLLAHSMGGLVVRACIHQRRAVMDQLMQRDGARFVMLGTPNQGAYSMVENLLGKASTLRTLVRLDLKHDMQQVLDIVAGFRGALQLLPKPGFVDMFEGQPEGGVRYDLHDAATWTGFKPKVHDRWFGDGHAATPAQDVLDSSAWLWRQDGLARPALPAEYAAKSAYVFGLAPNTPCGVREQDGTLKMVGTTRGDGTVSWESGRIDHVDSYFYLPAAHGDLPSTSEYFPALSELLATGTTRGLSSSPPAERAIEQPRPVTYDAGPPSTEGGDALARGLLGGSPRSRVTPRPKRRLEVAVKAMDLRFLACPVMVGAYEQDPIAGPQGLIDRELLDGDLSQRRSLGLYAGPLGSATVVLRVPNPQERQRGSLSGAVVIGLGTYDGALSVANLTDAVRAGVLRYLLQVIDVLGKEPREVPLAALLLGYNSSANLSVSASVEALVRGVLEANAKFAETTRLNIRVARLNLIELYQDTAITAVYALRAMPAKLGGVAQRTSTALVCQPDLARGEGMRQRLFDGAGQSYWPRLMITEDRSEDADPADAASEVGATAGGGGRPPHAGRTAIAERLRFLYVGQRARAESVVQQRQPGLIEALVRQQIHHTAWNEDIGRMLFQLMVPHDFKDAARQLERVVLVVDSTTANLPWELMLADAPGSGDDSLPMAVRTPVVRQLASTRFRRQVRQSVERTALVVGNPSVEGFGAAFADPRNPEPINPPPLPGAEAEAAAVVGVLGGLNYRVTQAIGADQRASEVLALLYRQPYRIVHVSAHGVFDLLHRDGRRRSGVVLSDGLLITAAEIAAMECVPELVYLSCCHLGQIDTSTRDASTRDATVRDGNKLAASVAAELIDIGVRCVVVAGWAVDDAQAQLFGETFYRSLLQQRLPFGDAVFQARRAAWESKPEDITWGAFQAYGDPGWRAEPHDRAASGGETDGPFASPEELLDALAAIRAALSRRQGRQTERDTRAQGLVIDQLLASRCPPAWLALPSLQSALGAAWRDLGRYEDARAAYMLALQDDDRTGRVPIKDVEQLANVESRLGELHDNETLARRALERLQQLDALVTSADGVASPPNVERCALQGSAWKRLASIHARRVLAPGLSAAALRKAGDDMGTALVEAVAAYALAEGAPSQARFEPFLALNRLALDALTPWASNAERDAALALGQQCAEAASLAFRREAGFFNAIMQPEAMLVEGRLDDSLGQPGDAGRALFERIAAAYREALSNITFKPKELDVVVSQMSLMSRFHDALSVVERTASPRRAAAHRRMADRLIALAEQLQPGACRRDDRPVGPAAPPPPPRPSAASKTGKSARRNAVPKAKPRRAA